jgi:hypothetical protein
MLDAGYWIPDIQDYFNSEIEKHPASRGQHPVSANTGKGFRRSDLDMETLFMQLAG